MTLTGENESPRRETSRIATFCTTNRTRTGLGLKPSIGSERQATNILRLDTALIFVE